MVRKRKEAMIGKGGRAGSERGSSSARVSARAVANRPVSRSRDEGQSKRAGDGPSDGRAGLGGLG